MVGQVSHRGFRDWLIQRFTAVLIGFYAVYVMVFVGIHPGLTFDQWKGLFDCVLMRIATIVVLCSVLWHVWIGLWTVFTDYVKSTGVRFILEAIVCLLLIVYLIWLLVIIF